MEVKRWTKVLLSNSSLSEYVPVDQMCAFLYSFQLQLYFSVIELNILNQSLHAKLRVLPGFRQWKTVKKLTCPTLQNGYKASAIMFVMCLGQKCQCSTHIKRTFKNGHNCILPLKHHFVCLKRHFPGFIHVRNSDKLCSFLCCDPIISSAKHGQSE